MGLRSAGVVLALAASLRAAEESPSLDERAREIFQQHCAACHGRGKNPPQAGLNVLDRKRLIEEERRLVVPGQPDQSELLQLVECGSMPPGNKKKVSGPDRKVLREWIAHGANFPPRT